MSIYEVKAVGIKSEGSKFEKFTIGRGVAGESDIDVDIKYCGLCHSDIYFVENTYKSTQFPCVPGHEIAGIVTRVGQEVTDIEVGDHVGIGCFVDSCFTCEFCTNFEENLCATHSIVFNGSIQHQRIVTDNGRYTYGGFSNKMTVNRRFAFKVPKSYPLEYAGPVFCSGITMFSPLKRFNAHQGGLKVGILGLGGLGQMGIKIAVAMGNSVTAISTRITKEPIARELGADNFIVSTEASSMTANAGSLDLILDTISANHKIQDYLPLLKRKGTLVLLGLVTEPPQLDQNMMVFTATSVTGSIVGGTTETQECIDFFAKHDIRFATKMVTTPSELDEAVENLIKGNENVVRFVVDIDKCT